MDEDTHEVACTLCSTATMEQSIPLCQRVKKYLSAMAVVREECVYQKPNSTYHVCAFDWDACYLDIICYTLAEAIRECCHTKEIGYAAYITGTTDEDRKYLSEEEKAYLGIID